MTVSGTLLPYPLLQFLPPQPWLSSNFSATLPLLLTIPLPPSPFLQFLPPQPWLSAFFSATLLLLPTMPSQDLANMAWAATVWQSLAAKAAAAEEGTATVRAAAADAAQGVQAVAVADAVLEIPATRSTGGALAAASPPLTLPHSDNRGRSTASSEADAPQPSSSSTQRSKPSPSTLLSSPQQSGRRSSREQPLDSSPGGSDSDDDAPAAPPAQPLSLRLDASLGSDSDEDAPVVAHQWWSSSSGAASGRSAQAATSVPRLMAPPTDLLIQHPLPLQQQNREDPLKAPMSPQTLPLSSASHSLSPDSYSGDGVRPLSPSSANASSATSVSVVRASSAGVSSSAAEVSSAVSVIPRRWQLQLLSQFEERIAASPLTRLTADSALHQPQQQQAGRIPSSSSPGLRPTLFSSPSSITPGRAVGAAALHFQPQALATLCWCIGQLRLLPAPWVPELLLQAG